MAPTPETAPTILLGPLAGELRLSWDLIAFLWANSHQSGDMGMEATFHNPSEVEDWIYGFAFASEPSSAVLAMFTDDGYWAVSRWVRGRGHKIEQAGLLPGGALKTGVNARNHVKVILSGTSLAFYVNGQRASMDADMSPFEIDSGGDFGVFVLGEFPRRQNAEDNPVLWYEQYQVWEP